MSPILPSSEPAAWGRAARWAALALAAALAACGGDDDSPQPPTGPAPSGGALLAARPGEVLQYVKSKLDGRAEQRLRYPAREPAPVLAPPGATAGGAVATVAATADSHSGTTVQEAGVDEDDLLKTDGSLLLALQRGGSYATGDSPGTVQVHRRQADGRLEALSRLALPGLAERQANAEGMYHAASLGRAAVLSQANQRLPFDICRGEICPALAFIDVMPYVSRPEVWLDVVDLADPAKPSLAPRIRLDGTLLGSRRIGALLVVVTQHTPVLPLELVPADAPPAVRADLVDRLKATDLLPTVSAGAATRLLAEESDCYLQSDNASLGVAITNISVFDLAQGGAQVGGRCFVGGSEALYMSSSSLYLATTRYAYDANAPVLRFVEQVSTDIHKFALESAALSYRGSGSVVGHLGWDPRRSSYRLSEHAGDLRVLTHTNSMGWTQPIDQPPPSGIAPSPAHLSLLREASNALKLEVIASLPNARRPEPIGKPDEQVYAVRFVGNRGYVVTFRRIDPLYVLDLSDPTDPRTVGELLTAGFSDHLFPLGPGWLLGVGHDATPEGRTTGVKVALFDVADATRPREAAALTFGTSGSFSGVSFGPHGIDLHTVGSSVRVGLPMHVVSDATSFAARRGLQRLEVDLAAGRLAAGAMLAPGAGGTPHTGIQDDRSVQIGDMLHYLADGAIVSQPW